jgi:Cu(I)/Ag(I) efflux system membrane fusion protein/cobalt-zinc-cadmium efflux system membrane fusion protein
MMSRMPLSMALAVVLVACAREAPPPVQETLPAGTVVLTPARLRTAKLRVDTVRLEEVSLPLRVPATVVTPELASARVGSLVEGRVDEVRVIPGDRVTEGAPLLLIHSHELATAVRDQATAQAELQAAQAAYDRSSRLLADEAVAKEEVERRAAQLATAKAEARRSQEMIDHLSPSPNGDVTVRAPRAGVVFQVHVRSGEVVTPGAALVDLGDPTQLWATGFVPENAAIAVMPGTRVAIVMDAMPGDTVMAKVVRAGGVVDSLRRAVEVRVALERVPTGARSGMFASMVLPAGARMSRVVLPEAAVQRMADGEVVFVQETPGRFRARPVKSQPLGGGRVAVEGLAAGTVVVTEGAYFVRAALEGVPGEEA